MITLLTGENSFEVEREIARIIAGFAGNAERVDGSELELRQLPDLLMGSTLFADKRLVIIKNLSENKAVWTNLADWLPRISDDITLVLVESKPDKRTVAFKELNKVAKVKEFQPWTDRDAGKLESWIGVEAKLQGVELNKKCVQLLIQRVGPDQWQLFHALEKLALVDEVTPRIIEEIIDPQPSENVFNLFETALKGNMVKLTETLRTLELSEDPYRLFALLSGQAFQLAVVAVAAPGNNVAKDFGVHPYVVSKLSSAAKSLGKSGTKKIIMAFAKADDDMKISKADPWLLIEQALLIVATGAK